MLTLFAAKGTVAVAAHVALQEAKLTSGQHYKVMWINFANGDQQRPGYLAINPKGRVPALQTDDALITETPAILEYIADISGTMMPQDVTARARVREMLAYCASTFHVNHAHKMRGARWSDDSAAHASMQAKVPQTMSDSCAYIESRLTGGWIDTDYSIADIHLYAICRWLKDDAVTITDFPKLAAHFATMQARAAVATVAAAHAQNG